MGGSPHWISSEQEQAIAGVPHFRNSAEGNTSAERMIGHYVAWYVDPLLAFGSLADWSQVLDAGTGYGWLSFALALRTPWHVTAVDRDERRLQATRAIADILGLSDRIDFVPASVGQLPFKEQEFDVTFCIEVLEHVHAARAAAACELARVTRNLLTVTTPNRHFPVIGHDTALPFCHMLPIPLRDRYAARFNRQRRQEGNLFWSAHELHVCLSDFERVSRFLNFPNYRAYRRANSAECGQANPLSVPMGVRTKRVFYGVARLAAKYSDFIMPNLASTYRRRKVGH